MIANAHLRLTSCRYQMTETGFKFQLFIKVNLVKSRRAQINHNNYYVHSLVISFILFGIQLAKMHVSD